MLSTLKNWLHKKPKNPVSTGVSPVMEFRLIEGTFTPLEAADVLLSLINYKIKFHSVQLLNLGDKNLQELQRSEDRIAELKKVKHQVTELILKSRETGCPLNISSPVKIKFQSASLESAK
ncbi:MAG: hypothetical protein AAGF77_10000 [Bacteroidota bacterium]